MFSSVSRGSWSPPVRTRFGAPREQSRHRRQVGSRQQTKRRDAARASIRRRRQEASVGAASGREDLIEVHSVQTRARSRTRCATRCRCAPFRSRTLSAPREAAAAARRPLIGNTRGMRSNCGGGGLRSGRGSPARAPSPRGNQLVPRPALAVSSVTSAPRPDKRFSSVSGQLARSVGR